MKVDFYWGRDSSKMFGVNRLKIELFKGLPKEINKKKISYNPKNRIINFFDLFTFTPFTTWQKRRKSAITQVLCQSEGHILHFFKFRKSVVLCADIIPILSKYGNTPQRIKAWIAYKGMIKADHITAISQFTKDEIIKHLGYPKEKITVTYIGVDHEKYKPINDVERVRKKYNLDKKKKYIIFVGNEEPRMNIETILRAMTILKEKYPELIFLKGGESNFRGMREKLVKSIKEKGLQSQVRFLGYIPEEDMPSLLNISEVSVYMCSYAGFGLPPLEAMACGTATITTNVSSLKEITGEGAITIGPKDHKELAIQIEKLFEDKKFKENLVKKGIKQSKKFTWKHFVDKHIEVYKSLER
jgi:glycosyltransferase involved in cell wall biosynthesis